MRTKQLSDFLCQLQFDLLPSTSQEKAKQYVEDLLCVAIAGATRTQGQIWRHYYEPFSQDTPVSTAWVPGFVRLSCDNAAALNAACAHVMDMDDVHNRSITHLGAVTIPAALAVGQALHRSGREVIAAIAAGYEIGARVGEAINPGSYHYWHTTGVVGPLCSAVAAGKLMGLDQSQMLHAIGSAGTQSAGLWQFLEDGAMSKTLHTANATLCGLRSAKLAALGFTAAQDILAGDRGLLGAMTPDNHPQALTQDLDWAQCALLSNSLKPYACCRHTHSANYCAELIQKEFQLDVDRIVRIVDHTYQVAVNTVDNPVPTTAYGYKFSGQYCIAAMLYYGHLQDSVFTPEATANPEVQRLMQKITLVCDPELERGYQKDHNRWGHRLEITMDDGQVISRQVEFPYGDFNNPFSWDSLHEKFRSLTSGILSGEQICKLTERLPHLDQLKDVNQLFEGL